eukprot:Skav207669  [mRNA]  locus=scaffold1857:218912:230427:- [translate_table: standard]
MPGVSTPQIPGDVSLVGNLEAAVVAQLAPRYKGWLYLNSAESKHFHRKEIEAAGCQVEVAPIPTPKEGPAGAEHAAAVIAAIEKLPKPLTLNQGVDHGSVQDLHEECDWKMVSWQP